MSFINSTKIIDGNLPENITASPHEMINNDSNRPILVIFSIVSACLFSAIILCEKSYMQIEKPISPIEHIIVSAPL